jgi:hypothetical protein
MMNKDNERELEGLQRDAFKYFLQMTNPDNGLVHDHTGLDIPASIAVVGMALACYVVAVERKWLTRDDAIQRTLTTLRFFWNSPQGTEPNATGYKGFYYHFLGYHTGKRACESELSTIDTGCLLAGMLTARTYFQGDSKDEREIRQLADDLYRRVDWQWVQGRDHGPTISHGWTPEHDYLPWQWLGYNESLFLYILALGSPTHPLSRDTYANWLSGYVWKNIYGYEFVYAGPLFIHQYSHLWLDLRGIQDEYMRAKGIDYFENSRRACYVQQQYAIRNPLEFKNYGEQFWGLTASDGPGPMHQLIDGILREFYDYHARGAPYGPDDGTITPAAVMASLPFAPEIVLPTIKNFIRIYPEITGEYGCKATVNPTFPSESGDARGWISPQHYGLNQGPLILMIENYRSGLLWELMRKCPYRVEGLRRAGFTGSWL